jgi:hypothetical protein
VQVKEQLPANMLKYLYTKQGYLVPLVVIAAYMVVRVGSSLLYNDATFYEENLAPRFLTSIIIGVSLWYLGKKLNPAPKEKKRKLQDLHTFLLVSMEYWGPIIAIGTIISYFK